MAKKPPSRNAAKIDAVRHKDKRKYIPTEELRDFVREDEQAPKTILYPRDPDLDPQLVWKGKDEEDLRPLEVPAVPVYIQEKIHPQAIIENFRQSVEDARPLISQLVRSGTSVGANYSEADEACTRKDFRYRIALCKREVKETKHWRRMISAAAPDAKAQARDLWREARELQLIFAAVYRKSAQEA